MWRREGVPREELAALCKDPITPMSDTTLEQDWLAIRPEVAARFGDPPPGEELDRNVFRSEVLLPGLAASRRCQLSRLIVSAVLTAGNTAQLERDMKAIGYHSFWKQTLPFRNGFYVFETELYVFGGKLKHTFWKLKSHFGNSVT